MKIKGLLIAVVLFLAAVILIKPAVVLYIDYLWFGNLGYSEVFKTVFIAKAVIFVLSFLFIFGFLYGNLKLTQKLSSSGQRFYADDILRFEGIDIISNRLLKLSKWIIAGFSFLFVSQLSGLTYNFLAFINKAPFNHTDPIFAKDISFYIFSLPILKITINWLKGLSIFALFITAASYILNGSVQFSRIEKLQVTAKVKKHILGLVSLIFVFQGIHFLVEKYILLLIPAKHFTGATYLTSHINIPFLTIIAVLSFVSAVICIYGALKEQKIFWVMPVASAAGIFALYTFVMPAAVKVTDKFMVQPNELRLETPYISNAIDASRKSLGLDNIKEKGFSSTETLTSADISANRSTVDNIRLWDHKPLLATYGQLQEIRTYYDMFDVDNDRYTIDGKYRQVAISAREMNYQKLPSSIWINERLVYTHGYGVVASFVNEFTKQGLPEFIVKNIPPVSSGGLKLKYPHIYFGELSGDFVITNTNVASLDYPYGDKNIYADYKGTGGLRIKSLLHRLAFAVYFGSFKILFSSDVTAQSRILMNRNIHHRIRKIAPFLRYESDPYPVISEGRIFWIVDAYTYSSNYPYSERFIENINYIRNSVKVVIDAFNGTTNFYVADNNCPVLKTYQNFLPSLFKPMSEMPKSIKTHLRYPKELFNIQARAFLKYHMNDVKVFYNQEDIWQFPFQLYDREQVMLEPYYTIMKLPDNPKEEYILMLPFTPIKKDNMIAWLAARSDGKHAGELLLYRFSKEKLVYGPMQIEARINQDGEISQQFTLWGQKGTRIIRGSLMVIPIENSLIYVEPVYLQAEIGRIPELRKVIVVYGDKIAMEDTLDEALSIVISGGVKKSDKRQEIILNKNISHKNAHSLFIKSQKYLKQGKWGEYGETVQQLGEMLKELSGKN